MNLKLLFVNLVCLLLVACTETNTPSYTDSSLYVFGDSLSDVGNANLSTAGLVPDNNYYQGRFSNGPLYVDVIAEGLSTSMKPSRAFGSNYAFAGVKSVAVNAQVFNYSENVDQQADPNATYIVCSGANDLLDILQNPNSDSSVQDAIQHMNSAITGLVNIGVAKILVPNQINMARLPRIIQQGLVSPDILTTAAELSNEFNTALDVMLDDFSTVDAVQVIRFDTFTLFEDVVSNPANYSLSNVTESCYEKDEFSVELSGNETICENPDAYLFWDSLHPTAAGHAILAEQVNDVL